MSEPVAGEPEPVATEHASGTGETEPVPHAPSANATAAESVTVDVLGRPSDSSGGPVGSLGRFLARDGSLGGRVGIDLDRPHVVSIVGKHGSGKSHTLGVLAEALAETPGVTGVVVDTMGVFRGLAACGARVVSNPRVDPAVIRPGSWPAVVGLDASSPAGSLVWRAARECSTVDDMLASVESAAAGPGTARVAANHLERAAAWGCFAPDGVDAATLRRDALTVLDCSDVPGAARTTIVGAIARILYQDAVTDASAALPWLLVDEAHACYEGPATAALDTVVTRGRQPGVSIALATQQPGALPAVAISQTDLFIAHRLTDRADVEALERAQPTYLESTITDRLPTRTGDALVVDDTSETAATIRVRDRRTPHGGRSPRAARRSRKC